MVSFTVRNIVFLGLVQIGAIVFTTLSAGATLTMDHYGASRTWLCAGSTGFTSGWGNIVTGSLSSFMIRAD